MIKFDIVHIFENSLNNINLSGVTFKLNGDTTNNKETKDSLITYIGETSISLTDNKKIQKKFNIKQDDIYMITFLSSDIDKLYTHLQNNLIECTKPKYDTKTNILGIPCKTKFKYMYVSPIKNSNFTFCFREIDTSSDLIKYQQAMIPNSAANDITGIKEIKIYNNFSKEDFLCLSKFFETSYIDNDEFSAEIYNNETLTFINSSLRYNEITFEVKGKVFKGKEISINGEKNNINDNKKNITFIY